MWKTKRVKITTTAIEKLGVVFSYKGDKTYVGHTTSCGCMKVGFDPNMNLSIVQTIPELADDQDKMQLNRSVSIKWKDGSTDLLETLITVVK